MSAINKYCGCELEGHYLQGHWMCNCSPVHKYASHTRQEFKTTECFNCGVKKKDAIHHWPDMKDGLNYPPAMPSASKCHCGKFELVKGNNGYYDAGWVHHDYLSCDIDKEPAVHVIHVPRPGGTFTLAVMADRAFRFLAGLQLTDQPLSVQKEYLTVVRELGAALSNDKARK